MKTEIDKIIGENIKTRRLQLGMSQGALGKEIGVTFQQIQKYEKGHNALTLFRFLQIASALHVHPMWLINEPPSEGRGDASEREVLEMIKRFGRLSNARRNMVAKFISLLNEDA